MSAKDRRPSPLISIIIPVYGDWTSLEECIAALLCYVDTSMCEVIFSNDRGPDHAILEKNIKKMIRGKTGFRYHANARNMGFLQNCNNAVKTLAKPGSDILLLNSDTEVTKGFAEALYKVLVDNPAIGAVSPRSNNATIATIPIRAMQTKNNTPQQSYANYRRMSPLLPDYDMSPVAHGFCILIRRRCIEQYGLFDEIFGKGYGEEVDFCRRIAAYGYESAICNRAFVYHHEARSFSMETKKRLISENEKIVEKRYPSYRRLVRDYRMKIQEREDIIERRGIDRLCVMSSYKIKRGFDKVRRAVRRTRQHLR